MKRILTFFVAIYLVSMTWAQDISVKKGQILVDKRPIAKVEKKDKMYLFSDLSGTPLFSAIATSRTPLGNVDPSKFWLEIKGQNGVVREMEMGKVGFTLSYEKMTVEGLIKSEAGLITLDGVNAEKIASFFDHEDRSISKLIDERKEAIKAQRQKEDELAREVSLKVEKGTITAKGKAIGYITKKTINDHTAAYAVGDLNKFKIAELHFSTLQTNKPADCTFKTYDGKEFVVPDVKYSDSAFGEEIADRFVRALYFNGYTLGNMKEQVDAYTKGVNDAMAAQDKALEDKAKATSANIYDVQGYIIDPKTGEKKEGLVTIEFESIDAKLKRQPGMADATNYGGTVSIKEQEGKKATYYKANKNVIFGVGDRRFLGVKSMEDGAVSGNTNDLSFLDNRAQFFEIIYEKDGNYVLAQVLRPEVCYLKLANQEKAIYLGDKGMFGKKSPEKVKELFDKYVKCGALNFATYEIATKEGLVKVVDDYVKSCK